MRKMAANKYSLAMVVQTVLSSGPHERVTVYLVEEPGTLIGTELWLRGQRASDWNAGDRVRVMIKHTSIEQTSADLR
jgi:hypothetical protein